MVAKLCRVTYLGTLIRSAVGGYRLSDPVPYLVREENS